MHGSHAAGGRHAPAPPRRRTTRAPLVVAAVAVVAVATVLVVQSLADAGGCRDDGVPLAVGADPAITPALREVAGDWTGAEEPEIDGQCVAVQVTAVATADLAATLATSAGGSLDVAAATPVGPTPAATATATPGEPDPPDLPAVWVPDSTYWLDRLRAVSRTLFEPDAPPLATSPIVLAVSPAGAEVFGAGPIAPEALAGPVSAALANPGEATLRLTVAEPRRDTAGLVGAGWLRSVLAPGEADLPDAVRLFRGLGEVPPDTGSLLAAFGDGLTAAPVSEQAVLAYHASAAASPDQDAQVTAVPVVDAPALDFPYAVRSGAPRGVQTAARMFRDVLAGSGDVLARHGFRAPDGTAAPGFPAGHGVAAAPVPVPPVPPPEQLAPLLRIWTSSRSDARVLSVVNVNASMAEPVADGVAVPRITVFQQTAELGLSLFTENSQLGHWEYADEWVEGVPIDTLDDAQQRAILDATAAMQIRDTNQSAMFETLLAAYRQMKEEYDPTRSNTLVLWTDGGDTVGELTLEETLAELERLADVTRPIRVILLGLGQDANMADLEAIAEATGGGAYQLVNPDEVRLIFLRALLT